MLYYIIISYIITIYYITFRVQRLSSGLRRLENLWSEMKVSWSTVMMWLSTARIQDTDLTPGTVIYRVDIRVDISI